MALSPSGKTPFQKLDSRNKKVTGIIATDNETNEESDLRKFPAFKH